MHGHYWARGCGTPWWFWIVCRHCCWQWRRTCWPKTTWSRLVSEVKLKIGSNCDLGVCDLCMHPPYFSYCKDEREEGRLKGDLKRLYLETEELKEMRNSYEVTRPLMLHPQCFSILLIDQRYKLPVSSLSLSLSVCRTQSFLRRRWPRMWSHAWNGTNKPWRHG